MKKLLFFILSILISFSPVRSLISNASASDFKVLVIGDSISSGYGLEGYPDGDFTSYGRIFSEKIGISPDNYINLSIDGETTSGLLWRLENSKPNDFSGYDAVIVSSGGNDLLDSLLPSFISIFTELTGKSYTDTDLIQKLTLASERFFDSARKTSQEAEHNLSQILSKLKEKNPSAYTAVLSVYDPFDDVNNSGLIKIIDRTLLYPCIDLLNSHIKKAADDSGFRYIDIAELFNGKANDLTNIKNYDIHPNTGGHTAIAQILAKDFKDFKASDVFLTFDEAKRTNNFAKIIIGCATIAAATLFGCSVVVISFGKYRGRFMNKQ